MKKIKILSIGIILLSLTGCLKNDSMEDINIVTSSYPIEYVVDELYGEHSTISSIYPKDDEIIDFEVTEVLLDQYSNSELFIFSGISSEKKHVEYLLTKNKDLKIIDVSADMNYEYSKEELWLDPNNLLNIANNVRKGFNEYIDSAYLINEVNEKYENLKIQLTSLDGKYYSTLKNSHKDTIIVSDDSFKFLEKYGIEVISLDSDTAKDKNFNKAKELLSDGTCKYIFIKYQEKNDKITKILNETNAKSISLYTMTNLKDINVEKNNYISLMNENLENLKLELY